MTIVLFIFLILIIGFVIFLGVIIQYQACQQCPFHDKCEQLMNEGKPNLCEQNNMDQNIWNNQTNCL